MFLFFTDLAARPERFILETPLAFDLLEIVAFLSALLFISFCEDFIDFDACDFLLRKLRLFEWLLTVPLSYSG